MIEALSKKASPTNFESFLMTLFDLNQISGNIFSENCEIWNFSATVELYIYIKSLRKTLNLKKCISVFIGHYIY